LDRFEAQNAQEIGLKHIWEEREHDMANIWVQHKTMSATDLQSPLPAAQMLSKLPLARHTMET